MNKDKIQDRLDKRANALRDNLRKRKALAKEKKSTNDDIDKKTNA